MPLALFSLCLALILAVSPARAEEVRVFAAASLKSALSEIAADWQARSGHQVVFSFAGTPMLARQIQAGAAADLFIPASADWMQALADSGDVQPASRIDLLSNDLVLVGAAPPVNPPQALDDAAALRAILGQARLAVALVDAVPAGIYGKQALQFLGLWTELQPRLVQADNVTAALQFVASGAVDFAIVYATDAKARADVHLVGTFPPQSHDPIIYPAALTREGRSAAAAAFLAHLAAPEARLIWQRAGFKVLP